MTKPTELDYYFDTSVSNVANPTIGVAATPFDIAFEQGLYDQDLTKPEGYETPEIKEATKPIDVAGGSKALEGSVDQNVLLFSEEEKEKERKKLGTIGDPLDIQTGLATRTGMSSDVVDLGAITGDRRLSQTGGIGVLEDDPITPAREDLGQEEAEDLFEPAEEVPQIGIKELDEGYDIGKKIYDQFTFESPTYSGSETITTAPSTAGKYLGSGVDLYRYTDPFRTGLSSTAMQSSIGVSAAPPASLAGQGTGLTQAPYLGSPAANTVTSGYGAVAQQGIKAGTAAAQKAGFAGTGYGSLAGAKDGLSWAGAAKVGGQILALYNIGQAFASGTNEGKVSGTFGTVALAFPQYLPLYAAYEGLKLLTGWGGFGSWFGGGKQKPPMGGVEFRVTSQDIIDQNNGMPSDSDQSAWLNAGDSRFEQAAKDNKLRITVPYSWGYNGFAHPELKKQAQKQIDFMYAFADRYGVDVNEDVFIKAATGSGGFQKYKPVGDRGHLNHSVLERIDSVGNGSESANQWLREVFEYEGPNGEKIISGNPMSTQVDPVTGLKKGFTSQEEFEADVKAFSEEFYS